MLRPLLVSSLLALGMSMALASGSHKAPTLQKARTAKTQKATVSKTVQAGKALIARIVPKHAANFIVEQIPRDPKGDVFEIESRGSKIVLRGNNGVSIASAFNRYLEGSWGGQVSWGGDQLNLPSKLPRIARKIRVVSPYRYRYDFNYCTFNYSMSWWDWKRWEREIDWMALHGINMPLALTGQEAVWQRVYKKMGFTEDDLKPFFCGPAYFSWFWMGNLDGWGGPLPQSWLDSHAALQKKILARQRELGMTPVLPAFSGHVPPTFKKVFPDAKLKEVQWGAGLASTLVLDPYDPLFIKVGQEFIKEQTKMYGSDHLYSADTFNEQRPPTNDAKYLTDITKAVYDSMAGVDPKAVWVMQGWLFVNDPSFWQAAQRAALFQGVPENRMIVLDLWAELAPVWKSSGAFNNTPWIWCMLHNFGGRQSVFGGMPEIASGPSKALKDPMSGKMWGIGLSPEAIENNDVIYKLMMANTWTDKPIPLDQWMTTYVKSRYGSSDKQLQAAWQILARRVYIDRSRGDNLAGIVNARPRLNAGYWASQRPSYYPGHMNDAVNTLLLAVDEAKASDPYRYDLVDFTRQVLSNLAGPVFDEAIDAYKEKDRARFTEASNLFIQIVTDMDRVVGTRKEFLLGKWIADARRCGFATAEKDLYEMNARRLLTLWAKKDGPLNEYSARQWSGLLNGFAKPRWQQFFQELETCLNTGKTFDGNAFERKIQVWEEDWVNQIGGYSEKPSGNEIATVKAIMQAYRPAFRKYFVPPPPPGLEADATITESSHEADHDCSQVIDGMIELGSAWWAGPGPQWVKIDLKSAKSVRAIEVYPYWGDGRYYQYTVEVSTDGQTWEQVGDMRTNTKSATSKGDRFSFDPMKMRYVRVNMLHNSANPSMHLVEVRILP